MALAEHLWGAPSHHIAKAEAPRHKQQSAFLHVQRLITGGGGGCLALEYVYIYIYR